MHISLLEKNNQRIQQQKLHYMAYNWSMLVQKLSLLFRRMQVGTFSEYIPRPDAFDNQRKDVSTLVVTVTSQAQIHRRLYVHWRQRRTRWQLLPQSRSEFRHRRLVLHDGSGHKVGDVRRAALQPTYVLHLSRQDGQLDRYVLRWIQRPHKASIHAW